MSQQADAVEVQWVFRPDDPSKQGKREMLAPDVAALKVSEGLAKWPRVKPEPSVDTAAGGDDKPAAKAPRK